MFENILLHNYPTTHLIPKGAAALQGRESPAKF